MRVTRVPSRFSPRASLALAHPLLAAYSPFFATRDFRSLHIFVRRRDKNYAEVEVEDGASMTVLKKAAIAKLKLGMAPNRVRLLREVEDGGTTVLLDSRKTLAEQSIKEGSSVLVEIIAPDVPPASASEAAALENCQRLFAALREAELEPIPSSRSCLINLPEGVLWPQLGKAPLFVRDFYCGLYEGPLASCDPGCKGKIRKFIIKGNAGIGKSAFGAYLLWRAVKAGRTVVYTSDKVEYSFVMHSGGHVEVFDQSLLIPRAKGIMADVSTVFICDGVKPPVASAFTVLITSPKRERFKRFFELVGCEMLTMPVFFRHEVQDMLRTCFQGLIPEEAKVWERYKKWGGIVSYVLARLDAESQQLALSATDLDDLIFRLGLRTIEADEKAWLRLLHLKPAGKGGHEFCDPYNSDSYLIERKELASKYAVELVYNALEQRHFQRLLKQPIVPSETHSKLFGDLYEAGATKALLKGGDFEAFDCSTGAQVPGGNVTIPASTLHDFSSVKDLHDAHLTRQGLPTLYTPTSPNFTTVDAVLSPGNILVKFTTGFDAHDLDLHGAGNKTGEGAVPVADALGVSGDIVFYWVLPEESFKKACKLGKPFPVTGQQQQQQQGTPRTLKQYFVCVPFAFASGASPPGVHSVAYTEVAGGRE